VVAASTASCLCSRFGSAVPFTRQTIFPTIHQARDADFFLELKTLEQLNMKKFCFQIKGKKYHARSITNIKSTSCKLKLYVIFKFYTSIFFNEF